MISASVYRLDRPARELAVGQVPVAEEQAVVGGAEERRTRRAAGTATPRTPAAGRGHRGERPRADTGTETIPTIRADRRLPHEERDRGRGRQHARPRAPAAVAHLPAASPATAPEDGREPSGPREQQRREHAPHREVRALRLVPERRAPRERGAPATVCARTSARTPPNPVTLRDLPTTWTSRHSLAAATGGHGPDAPSSQPPGTLDTCMDDWRSYDDVAETYERVHAPRFAEPARDLRGAGRRRRGPARARRRHRHRRRRRGRRGRSAPTPSASTPRSACSTVGARGPPRAPPRGGRGDRPAVPRRHVRRRDRRLRAGALHAGRDRAVRPRPRHAAGRHASAFSAGPTGATRSPTPGSSWSTRWCRRSCSSPRSPARSRTTSGSASAEAVEEALLDAGLRHVRVERRAYEWTYSQDGLPRRARGLGDRPVRRGDARRRRRGRRSASAPGRRSPTGSPTRCTTAATCSWPSA